LAEKLSPIKVSLCLLTWNEIAGCKIDIPRIPRIFDRVYAIDNSSIDGTIKYLEQNGIEVIQQSSKSYNGAYRDAIRAAGDSAVVFFHPKGTIDVGSLNVAHTKMKNGIDFLLASRISRGAQNEEDHRLFKPRKWFVIFVALISKIRWGLGKNLYLNDPLHGYRGLSPSFYSDLALKSEGVTADLEMIRHAYKGKFASKTFPVIEIERASGSTHFPAVPTGRKILKFLFTSRNN